MHPLGDVFTEQSQSHIIFDEFALEHGHHSQSDVMYLFHRPIGSFNKTPEQTNMLMANQLPAPQSFLLESVQVELYMKDYDLLKRAHIDVGSKVFLLVNHNGTVIFSEPLDHVAAARVLHGEIKAGEYFGAQLHGLRVLGGDWPISGRVNLKGVLKQCLKM